MNPQNSHPYACFLFCHMFHHGFSSQFQVCFDFLKADTVPRALQYCTQLWRSSKLPGVASSIMSAALVCLHIPIQSALVSWNQQICTLLLYSMTCIKVGDPQGAELKLDLSLPILSLLHTTWWRDSYQERRYFKHYPSTKYYRDTCRHRCAIFVLTEDYNMFVSPCHDGFCGLGHTPIHFNVLLV